MNLQVTPSGLEPETYCLEGSCSIQLSYEALAHGAKLAKNGCKNRSFFNFYNIV